MNDGARGGKGGQGTQGRPPHPATVVQPKAPFGGSAQRPPHPAVLVQRRAAHPAAAAQAKSPRVSPIQRALANAPTFKLGKWKSILDAGFHNSDPVYIHYTSDAGYRAIMAELTISDKKRGEKREGSKPGIYVNPSSQRFNAANVETLLFLGNEKYIGNGDYVVIFSSGLRLEDVGPVTHGSWVREYKLHDGDVKLTRENLIFAGANPFPDVFEDQ